MESNFESIVSMLVVLAVVLVVPALSRLTKKENKPPRRPPNTTLHDWTSEETAEPPVQRPVRQRSAAFEGPPPLQPELWDREGRATVPGDSPASEPPPPRVRAKADEKIKNAPVFSANPVVNGIVWAEILTRGGTRRRPPQ